MAPFLQVPYHICLEAIGALQPEGGKSYDETDPRYAFSGAELAFLKDVMLDKTSLAHRSLFLWSEPEVPLPTGLGPNAHRAELPSSNGITNARSLALLASCMANNGRHKDFSLLPRNPTETLKEALTFQKAYSKDKVTHHYTAHFRGGFAQCPVQGMGLDTPPTPDSGAEGKMPEVVSAAGKADEEMGRIVYGWGGAGGSLVRFSPALRLGVAYVMNKPALRAAYEDPRAEALLAEIVRCTLSQQTSQTGDGPLRCG